MTLEQTAKPFKGEIRDWYRVPCDRGVGFYVMGAFQDHPDAPAGTFSNTSYVVKHDPKTGDIETKNSRYRLVGEEAAV